jgi:DNA repair photolyase
VIKERLDKHGKANCNINERKIAACQHQTITAKYCIYKQLGISMNQWKGRGTASNPDNRYQPQRSDIDDEFMPERAPHTEVRNEIARSIITRNTSPDLPFNQSINAYRGCEHGCIYCFARTTHAYLDLSPGIDFETKLIAKTNAADQLEIELRKTNYRCQAIAMGTNTDPYQPIERDQQLTRQLLEVLTTFQHPCSIITKSQLILRDIDLLAAMAKKNLCHVGISLTTLDDGLKTKLEPRTASGRARVKVIRQLSEAGIPVSVLAAPIIPIINDAELEDLLSAAAEAGAQWASWMMVRLPLEVAPLFEEWLATHFPLRAKHVMNIIQQTRGGKANDPRFHHRQSGSGVFADLLAQRFALACRKLDLNTIPWPELDTTQFCVPPEAGEQMGFW